MYNRRNLIAQTDSEVWAAIEAENQRQEDHIELIASENYASPAVLQAAGTQLTNKYAEGYPGRRYYGGCEFVDVVEQLAIDRVKKLFGAEAANVQPHCGASANEAVFLAFLKPGDTIMGMSLAEGGHLTHGMALNMSGKWFNVISYGLNEKEEIDYDAMERKAREHKPKLIVAGASAYSLEIDWARFARVAKEVGAIFMVDMAHYAGLIAGGQYPNPVPHADVVTSTTHKSLRGPRSGFILMKAEHEKAINSAVFPGLQGGPLMHVIAAKAVAFKEALSPEFRQYAEQVKKNAQVVAETLTQRGLRIVSGGTDAASAAAQLGLPPEKVFVSTLENGAVYRLSRPAETWDAGRLKNTKTAALAGIARPERFFQSLRDAGIRPGQTVALPDHARLTAADLPEAEAVFITEKDAVKLAAAPVPENVWVLPVRAIIRPDLAAELAGRLKNLSAQKKDAT